MKRFVFNLFRKITLAAMIIFLVVAAIGGAAKVALDYYLSTTCISGFGGSFTDACIAGK
jgi:hypothetical protein